MSLNKEIEELDKIREEEGAKSREHYAKLDLPGDRNRDADADAARKRVEEMKKEREAAGQGDLM